MAHMMESMFFVRSEPWHGLGNRLENEPNTLEAYAASGLDWRVNRFPLVFQHNGQLLETQEFALVRDKDVRVLGTCRERYNILQNEEAFQWCDPLITSDLWAYETAGALRNGEVCWILLKQGEIELVNQDVLKQYLLFMWSHDGSRAVQVMPTTIRVVCNNTLQVALNEAKVKNKIKHTMKMNMRLEEVRKIYSETKEAFQNQNDAFKRMLDTKIDMGFVDTYLDKVMTRAYNASIKDIDEMKEGKAKTELTKIVSTFKESVYKGTGTKELGIMNTLYGLFNGVEESVEHYIGGNRIKDRGNNILFGNGHDVVNVAFDTAMEMVAA